MEIEKKARNFCTKPASRIESRLCIHGLQFGPSMDSRTFLAAGLDYLHTIASLTAKLDLIVGSTTGLPLPRI